MDEKAMHQKAVEKSRRGQKNSWGITGSAKGKPVCLHQWGIMLLCVLFFSVPAVAADTPPANDADKWKIVEGQVKNLEASYNNALTDLKSRFDVQQGHMKNLEESYKNALVDLNSKFELQKEEADLKIRKIENDFQHKYRLLEAILSVGIIGLFVIIYKFYKWLFKNMEEKANEKFKKAEEIAEKQFKKAEEIAEQKFETLLREEKDRMFQLIRIRDDEIKLKKEMSLVVLSAPDGDENFLKNFFTKMKFEDVKYQNFGPHYRYKGEDLILFNNEDGKLKIDSINKFVAEGPDTVFYFYFGGGRVDFPPLKHYSFANVRGQLYGNLMNALLQFDLLK